MPSEWRMYMGSPRVAAPYPASSSPNTKNIMPMGNRISNPIMCLKPLYQKTQLSTTNMARTTTASTDGFWYQASPSSFGLSVSA